MMLENLPPAYIAQHLKNEYPQVTAVILTMLPDDVASDVLHTLPENLAMANGVK